MLPLALSCAASADRGLLLVGKAWQVLGIGINLCSILRETPCRYKRR